MQLKWHDARNQPTTPDVRSRYTSRSLLRRMPAVRMTLVCSLLALTAMRAVAQAPVDPASGMRWREIGPTRAGRARAIAGVPTQPNTFYAGFDNGGVWRSTDFGSNWVPLFDDQSTGSIGAIAVAPSDPNVIYVGTGAGIIRPDLATGDGVYKSTDAGRTWTKLGLGDTQMIAMIDVDPRDPNRLFVAALGHPYGPNAERGIFRSTDGGRSFQKVLYKDEYTSGNDVRIDPRDPNTIYATLWQQQQSFIEGQGFGGAGNGIFKSTDGGTTWKQLTEGLPAVIQANIALATNRPGVLYATVAGATTTNAVTGQVGFYTTRDGGEHWTKVGDDPRPVARIGGGDLPTLAVDPTDARVVYSASVVMWRTENGGETWSAVRGAPGGDDYQKIWINPTDPKILFSVTDQGAVVSANRGESWSDWYNQLTAAMYHVSTDDAFPYRVCSGQQDSGSACVDSRSFDGQLTFRDWRPVNIQEYGIAASDPFDPDVVFGSQRSNVTRYDRRTGQSSLVGPGAHQRGTQYGRNVRTMPLAFSPVDHRTLYYTSNVVWKSVDKGTSWTRISPDLARATWAVPANAGKYASTVTPAPAGSITALSPSPRRLQVLWAGTDDGNVQVTTNGGASWRNVTPTGVRPWTRIFNIDAGHFDTRTAYVAANTMRLDDMNPHFYRTHDGGATWTEINTGIAPGAVANAIREDPRVPGLLYASTDTQVWVSYDDGAHWESLRRNMPAISVRDLQVKDDSTCLCADLVAATHGRGFWILDDVTPLREAAATAGGARAGAREADDGGARALRDERPDAAGPRGAGRGEPAAGRHHRLLSADGGVEPGHAGDSRCARHGRAHVLERGHPPRPRPGARPGRLRPHLSAHPDGPRLWPATVLAGAAHGAHGAGGDAPRLLGPAPRPGLGGRRAAGQRRRRDGRGPAPHVRDGLRAVGAAGTVHRAPHGGRGACDAAAHAQARPAREDVAGRARAARHTHPLALRRRGGGPSSGGAGAQPRGPARLVGRHHAGSRRAPRADRLARVDRAGGGRAPPSVRAGRCRPGADARERERRARRGRDGHAERGRRADRRPGGRGRGGAGAVPRGVGAVEHAPDDGARGAERAAQGGRAPAGRGAGVRGDARTGARRHVMLIARPVRPSRRRSSSRRPRCNRSSELPT